MKRKELKLDVEIVGQEAQAQAEVSVEAIQPIISFDEWWLQAQTKYKFKPELKSSIKAHFKAKGITDFNKGLVDFGFKI